MRLGCFKLQSLHDDSGEAILFVSIRLCQVGAKARTFHRCGPSVPYGFWLFVAAVCIYSGPGVA